MACNLNNAVLKDEIIVRLNIIKREALYVKPSDIGDQDRINYIVILADEILERLREEKNG